MELALKGKEAELEGLLQTISLKDRTIQELQQELKRLRAERAAAEERMRLLEDEKARLEADIQELQSQARIHHLSLADLQDRLTKAYGEREELARKLRLAEEALQDKVRKWCESLCAQTC
jgi:chromosome segregation ATPase